MLKEDGEAGRFVLVPDREDMQSELVSEQDAARGCGRSIVEFYQRRACLILLPIGRNEEIIATSCEGFLQQCLLLVSTSREEF
jgi:hypothetical protein